MTSERTPFKLHSTRSEAVGCTFREAVMSGLAPDGGLFIPNSLPSFSLEEIAAWKQLPFSAVMFHICKAFVPNDQVPHEDLKELIERSCAAFHHSEVTPVVPLNIAGTSRNIFILELFHGPTLAFKDVALQFLGNLFEYILKTGEQKTMCVLGATSGDTGSAAIYGLKGKAGVELFMLYPDGRVSPFQEAQMTSVLDENIHNVAIDGTFDDGQAIVKTLFSDLEFREKYKLGAVNSINWARILAQISYYFYSYFKVAKNVGDLVHYSVPTGNFGDVLAGYYAKRIGLPIGKLIVATNDNDILDRLFKEGDYSKKQVTATTSPSMDIQISSNLERYLYYTAETLYGQENAAAKVNLWMSSFNKDGSLSFDKEWLEIARKDMNSHRVIQTDVKRIMRSVYVTNNYILDPHSAIGVGAALEITDESINQEPIVCLATAHAAKFNEAVVDAVGRAPDVPGHCDGLLTRDTRSRKSTASAEAIKAIIQEKLGS